MTTDLPLIPARNVVAHFARWAVQLAPLGTPERLPECLAALRVYMNGQWSIDSVRELLTRFTATDPTVRLWTYPLVKQDDPREPPCEEHLHIDPAGLVDRVVASLTVEARHAAEVYAAQGPAAEPLVRQGYRVHFRPGGQSEYLDFGMLSRITEIDLDATGTAPDMQMLLDGLVDRFPANFTADSVVSARGRGKEYRGLVDTDVRTQIMTNGEIGSTMNTERLERALTTLSQERGWVVRLEEDALTEHTRMRTVRLMAGPFECVVRTTKAHASLAYMVGTAMLQVPVEVSE